MRALAFAVGEEHAAERLLQQMNSRIGAAVARIRSEGRPLSTMAWTEEMVPGRDTKFDDVARLLAAVNVPAEAGLTGWKRVSAEQVLRWRPQVVVLSASPGEEEAAKRSFRERPLFAALETRLVVVPTPTFSSQSPHVAELVERLADAFYPR